MTEKILHFIWRYSLYKKHKLRTANGQCIKVISAGLHNTDSGPDFFNAKIEIEDTLWAGNVELHLNASDWIKHNHQNNKAYDNVILHIVLKNDVEIKRTNGEKIPVLILDFNKKILQKYDELLACNLWISCAEDISTIDSFTISSWLSCLMSERLERKIKLIYQNLDINIQSWEETLYWSIARGFGQNLNAEPFGLLAKSLPLKVILKQKNALLSIESLLFGQAGMLEKEDLQDSYYTQLRTEFLFLKHKFQLTPIESHLWKFLRLRPSNFPTLRISQFAALLFQNHNLFSQILDIKNLRDAENIFNVNTSVYWETHYTFGKKSTQAKKKFGKISIEYMVINSIAPMIFQYGKSKNQEASMQQSVELLESMKPEKNIIIKNWISLGIAPENACDSQALLELKKEYCDHKKCLDCRIGMKIIQQNIGQNT